MPSAADTTPRADAGLEPAPAPQPDRAPRGAVGRAAYFAYRGGAAGLRHVPRVVATETAAACGLLVGALQPQRRAVVRANLRAAAGPEVPERRLERLVWRAYADYGRYWADVARLELGESGARGTFTLAGEELLWASLSEGRGVVLALPHLGCWEVGGRWLSEKGTPLTTVAEPIRPRELFEWFVRARAALGMRVLEPGPSTVAELATTLRRGGIVALVADRDLSGEGVEVRFFGRRTTMPGGPAVLSLRTGAPLHPCAVFHLRGGGHHGIVFPAIDTERRGRLSADVARVTQDLASEMERLIRLAPAQWHVFQPRFRAGDPSGDGGGAGAGPPAAAAPGSWRAEAARR